MFSVSSEYQGFFFLFPMQSILKKKLLFPGKHKTARSGEAKDSAMEGREERGGGRRYRMKNCLLLQMRPRRWSYYRPHERGKHQWKEAQRCPFPPVRH
jgi:hypothetical protein